MEERCSALSAQCEEARERGEALRQNDLDKLRAQVHARPLEPLPPRPAPIGSPFIKEVHLRKSAAPATVGRAAAGRVRRVARQGRGGPPPGVRGTARALGGAAHEDGGAAPTGGERAAHEVTLPPSVLFPNSVAGRRSLTIFKIVLSVTETALTRGARAG